MRRKLFLLALCLALGHIPRPALAWSLEGHEVVALIADHYLDPAVRTKVHALLDSDTDTLTPHDIVHEANWADKFRDLDRDTTKVHYTRTYFWHFAAIEIAGPQAGDADAACFHEPALPTGQPASEGPEKDCIFHKIDEFAQELASPQTAAPERLLALKFLLHFGGDIHEPLNDTDNNNDRGNALKVTAEGFADDPLKRFWDANFVQALNAAASPDNPEPLADQLLREITPANVAAWSHGSAQQWAVEAHDLVKNDPYMKLAKIDADHPPRLTIAYIAAAENTAREQLKKAGVRLAYLLNMALK